MATSRAAGNVAKIRDIINVQDPLFGAVGDGSTYDTAAILAAIAAAKTASDAIGIAAANSNHPVSWFPTPIVWLDQAAYKVSAQITSAAPRIKLHGHNALISTLVNGVLPADYLVKFTAAYYLEVEGISFG